jgi:iron complex transport system permease protein
MTEEVTAGTDRTADERGRFAWLDRSLAAVCVGSLVVVAVAGFVQVRFGTFDMTWRQAYDAVTDPNVLFDLAVWETFLFGGSLPDSVGTESRIVWTLRIPRVVVAIFVGMNLAVSGAIFQAVTRNELASPFILGVSSGAGLMILLTLVVLSGFTLAIPLWSGSLVLTTSALLPLFAALGGIAAFVMVYLIAWKNGTSPVRLVLAGVVVGMVFTSLQRAMFFFAGDIGVVQQAIAWTTGSLTGVQWEEVRVILPSTLFVMGLAFFSARQLNVLLLGEKTASSLGMNVERIRFALSSVAVLAAAASIAVAGIVSFVGLVVPHVVRNLVGSDYKRLIVGCLFAGPALMVAADVVARLGMLALGGEIGQIPVGIVTGLIGGPYFLYLMRRQEAMGEI